MQKFPFQTRTFSYKSQVFLDLDCDKIESNSSFTIYQDATIPEVWVIWEPDKSLVSIALATSG